MLYLSCMPCNDSTECEVKTEASVSDGDHEQHEHESEGCTPFCICSCCAATAYYNTAKPQPVTLTIQPAKFPIHNTAFDTEVFYGIWQPPQLS